MAGGTRRLDLDRVGSIASLACAVHCALTGVALGALSLIGLGFLGSVGAEIAFFSTALVVGGCAIVAGYRRHGSLIPAGVFLGGVAILAVAHSRGVASHTVWESILSVLGGLTLVGFHFANQRIGRKACACPDCRSGHVR